MSATLSRKHRPLCSDGALDGGTGEEKAHAFGTMVSYCGMFEVDEATAAVTHIVEYATHPNLVGQRLKRICFFHGDRLKLDTPSMIMGGKVRPSYIEWQCVA
jgi:Lipocalin-like domain